MKLAGHHFVSTPIEFADRVSPSSCTQQCPVIFWTTVPFDFAVGRCNLVRKRWAQPPCPSARTWTWRWGDGCSSNSKVSTGEMAVFNENIRLDVPRIFQKLFQEDLKCPIDSQLHGKKLRKCELYKKSRLSKTKCHSKSFLLYTIFMELCTTYRDLCVKIHVKKENSVWFFMVFYKFLMHVVIISSSGSSGRASWQSHHQRRSWPHWCNASELKPRLCLVGDEILPSL